MNAIEIDGVCQKCKDVLEWKWTYGKYKPLKTPSKCLGCNQKTVLEAYHSLCTSCSSAKKVCPKCIKSGAIEFSAEERKAEEEAKEVKEALKWMNERERRSAQRKLDRGDDLSSILAAMAARKEEAQAAMAAPKGETEPAAGVPAGSGPVAAAASTLDLNDRVETAADDDGDGGDDDLDDDDDEGEEEDEEATMQDAAESSPLAQPLVQTSELVEVAGAMYLY